MIFLTRLFTLYFAQKINVENKFTKYLHSRISRSQIQINNNFPLTIVLSSFTTKYIFTLRMLRLPLLTQHIYICSMYALPRKRALI